MIVEEDNLIDIIKKKINQLNRIRRAFELDVSNMEHPLEHIEIFEEELNEIKDELEYVKKVYSYAKKNQL